MKDREPQNISDIEQEISHQIRSQLWDYGIYLAGIAEVCVLMDKTNVEPGILRAAMFLVPPFVMAGSVLIGFHRSSTRYCLERLKDGIMLN